MSILIDKNNNINLNNVFYSLFLQNIVDIAE